MKSLQALLLAALATPSTAHYIFNILVVNDQEVGGEYDYIRRNTNSYMPSFPDILTTEDLRCNVGARAGSTQTYEVNAGDKIGFKIFNSEAIEHPGPGFVYMSRAPDDNVATYDGSGEWFKAWESGLCGGTPNNDDAWCSWQKDRLEYVIPENVPAGEYLVRVEHIGLHEGHVGQAQFYMECAQLKINGAGGGTPGPLASIPGIYDAADPGIAYNKWTDSPAEYVMPGPAVWNGQ